MVAVEVVVVFVLAWHVFSCLPLCRAGHCENCEEPEEEPSPQPAVSSIQHDIDAPSLSEDESELLSSL